MMPAHDYHITLNQISYQIENSQTTLFSDLSCTFMPKKTGLVGKNGIGKTSLLRLIVGELAPTSGNIHIAGTISYCPQNFVFPKTADVAEALGVKNKLHALQCIEEGSCDARHYDTLNNHWDIKTQIHQQLSCFVLEHLPLHRPIETLSGGEKTRLLLARTFLSPSDFIILDEPTNNLDHLGRQQLRTAIKKWRKGLIVVSHDRTLLNELEQIVELDEHGCHFYGGNYQAYASQKQLEIHAANRQLNDAKKYLRHTQKSQQTTSEKQNHRKGLVQKSYYKGNITKLGYDGLRERGAKTQKRLRIRNKIMLEKAEKQLQEAKDKIIPEYHIQIDLPSTAVPPQKRVIDISNLYFSYSAKKTWLIENFKWSVQGPKRIALFGKNGSGKTTLVKLLLGEYAPVSGKIDIGVKHVKYLNQHINLLKSECSVLENCMQFNPNISELEARHHLARFLFRNQSALKIVKNLSMGEKLRATLACIFLAKEAPQLLILDEPTNHLDFESMRSLESALNCYQGALIVISHDQEFLENIQITERITTPFHA